MIEISTVQKTGMDIMKTTIEIDTSVLRQAQLALGTTTIKATVDASLREVVRKKQLQALADALGKIPLDLTSDQLRRQRAKRKAHAPR
jgi:Arc/MetJ family transcription regulator